MGDELRPVDSRWYFNGAGDRRTGCSPTGRNRVPYHGGGVPFDLCPPGTARTLAPVAPVKPAGDVADYRDMLLALLPPGEVWPRQADTVLGQVMEAVAAAVFAPVAERAAALLSETDPRLAFELLPRWEAWLGLPDGCDPLAGTDLTARRAAVLLRESPVAVRSRADLLRLLGDLGFPAGVEEQIPWGTGTRSRTGCARTGGGWFGVIVRVNCLPGVGMPRIGRGIAGLMRVGDRFPRPLDCLLRRLLPAHLSLSVVYH